MPAVNTAPQGKLIDRSRIGPSTGGRLFVVCQGKTQLRERLQVEDRCLTSTPENIAEWYRNRTWDPALVGAIDVREVWEMAYEPCDLTDGGFYRLTSEIRVRTRPVNVTPNSSAITRRKLILRKRSRNESIVMVAPVIFPRAVNAK
jgi:hypothetical protein